MYGEYRPTPGINKVLKRNVEGFLIYASLENISKKLKDFKWKIYEKEKDQFLKLTPTQQSNLGEKIYQNIKSKSDDYCIRIHLSNLKSRIQVNINTFDVKQIIRGKDE